MVLYDLFKNKFWYIECLDFDWYDTFDGVITTMVVYSGLFILALLLDLFLLPAEIIYLIYILVKKKINNEKILDKVK